MLIQEASQLLKIHPGTIRSWCLRGGLPYTVVGPHKAKDVKMEDLVAFIREKRARQFRDLINKLSCQIF